MNIRWFIYEPQIFLILMGDVWTFQNNSVAINIRSSSQQNLLLCLLFLHYYVSSVWRMFRLYTWNRCELHYRACSHECEIYASSFSSDISIIPCFFAVRIFFLITLSQIVLHMAIVYVIYIYKQQKTKRAFA